MLAVGSPATLMLIKSVPLMLEPKSLDEINLENLSIACLSRAERIDRSCGIHRTHIVIIYERYLYKLLFLCLQSGIARLRDSSVKKNDGLHTDWFDNLGRVHTYEGE
jgi:hypothetical protein